MQPDCTYLLIHVLIYIIIMYNKFNSHNKYVHNINITLIRSADTIR